MKLGVLIKTLGVSQLGLNLTQECGLLATKRHDIALTTFYNDHDKFPAFPKFLMVQSNQLWGYTGPVIATDVELAEMLLRCPTPAKKYLYLWNLEWLYTVRPFREFSNVYLNDELILIARSQSHASIFEKCWHRSCKVLEDFNHEQLAGYAA